VRKKVIAGNWKMHKTKAEAEEFIHEVSDMQTAENTEVIVCAPFSYLATLVEQAKQTNIKIAT